MKNLVSKLLLLIFVLQILGQIVLLTGVNPYTDLLAPFTNNSNSSNANPLSASVSGITGTNNPGAESSANTELKSTNQGSTNYQSSTGNTGSNSASISSVSALTGPSTPTFYSSAYAYSTSVNIDVGQPGNNRLIAIFGGVESLNGLTGTVTVGGKPATVAYRAQNLNSLGSRTELWVITESGLGSLSGTQTIQLGSGSSSSWGVEAMVFYGVRDSVTPYDVQYDITSVANYYVTPGPVNIPGNGLVVFGAGNGQPNSYSNSGWVSTSGSPSISMTETADFGISSAQLAQAYYISPYSANQTNRQLQAYANGGTQAPYRQSGIVATFQPAGVKHIYTQQLNPSSDINRGLSASSYGYHYSKLSDNYNTSTYVYEPYQSSGTYYDTYSVSTTSETRGQIQRVVVYALGRVYSTSYAGTILTQLGNSGFSSYTSGHSSTVTTSSLGQSSPSTVWDTFQNTFYTNYNGGFWKWSDLSSMTLRLTLNNIYISKIWIVVEYQDVQNPILSNYGVTDPGTGSATYWASASDDFGVQSVTMNIGGTNYAMTNNGTYWVYPVSGVTYGSTVTYQVSSVVDTSGNTITNPLPSQQHTFSLDKSPPVINSVSYIPDANETLTTYNNGTFYVNLTDYGIINYAFVNITTITGSIGNLTYNSTSNLWETSSIYVSYGAFSFFVQAVDNAGNVKKSNTYSGSQFTQNNHLPQAKNIVVTPSSPNTTQNLQLSYTYFDYDGQTQSGTQIWWTVNGVVQSAYNNSLTLPNSLFSKNDNITAYIRPNDGVSFGNVYQSQRISVIDSAPTASSVTISPSTNVYTTDTLTASYNYFDIDGDAQNTAMRQILWYKDGVLQTGLNNSLTVSPSLTAKNETWYFMLKISDGMLNSSWYTSPTIKIKNSVPVVTSASITPSQPFTNSTLTATFATSDADGDPVTYTIFWYKNDVLQPSLNNSLTVSPSLTAKGEVWYYTIQLFDGSNYSSVLRVNLETSAILNSPPILSSVTLSPSIVYSNGTLTFTTVQSDQDSGDTITQIIHWYKDNTLQSALDGMKTISSTYLTKGTTWYVSVQLSDGTNVSLVVNSSTVTIQNSAPYLTSVQISPFPAYTTSTLTASYIYNDKDNDPQNTTLRQIYWFKNGVLQPALNNSLTVSSSLTTRFQTWYFTIKVYDGSAYSALYTSPTITIKNSLPVVIPTNPLINNGSTTQVAYTSLYLNYTFSDADGDNASLYPAKILWYIQGTLNSSLTNLTTIPSKDVTPSSLYWYYTIQIYDGYNYSIVYTSKAVVIGTVNHPPVASYVNATFIGGINSTTSDIFLNYTFYDQDGNPNLGTVYAWYVDNGTGYVLTTYTSQTLPSSATKKGEYWIGQVTPKDGIDFGNAVNSTAIYIQDTAPVITGSLVLTPTSPTTSQDIVLTYTYFDADGDPQTNSNITWYVNGVYNSTFNGMTTIPSIYTSRGQNWTVIVVPYDGQLYGSPVSYIGNITIINTVPIFTSNPIISETSPYTTTNLTVSYLAYYYDADGDPWNGSTILWYKNGNLQPLLNNSLTVEFGNTTKSESWYFIFTPCDGYGCGLSYKSNIVTILNTPPTILAGSIKIDGTTNPMVHSNQSLILTYTYYDADADTQTGTKIYWYRNGLLVSSLNGFTTVPSSYLVHGDSWNVTIIPYDGSNYGANYSLTYSLVILDTAPVVSAYLSPSSPKTTDSITITYSYSDYDNDPAVTLNITWYNHGVYDSRFTNQTTIPSSYINKTDVWTAIISISDGTYYSNSYLTASVTVANSAPTLTSVTLTPTDANTSSTLKAVYSPHDADNDPVTLYSIYWFKNGINVTALAGLTTVPSSYTTKGESWYYKIVVSDGTNTSLEYTSNIVTIVDTAPVITSISFVNSIVLSNGTITLKYSFYDVDGDLNQSSIYWYRNGLAVSALTNKYTVPASYLQFGDTWQATVVPYDGILYGASNSTAIITIRNTPPTASGQAIDNNNNVGTAENLTLTYQFADHDGQSEVTAKVQIYWFNNFNTTQGSMTYLNNKTFVDSKYTSKNEIWWAEFRVYDGYNYSVWYRTANITILNTAPIITSISITNSTSSQNITVSYTYFDIDGDPQSNTIILWFLFGQLQPQYTGNLTIPASATLYNDYWSVQITPSDGNLTGLVYSASLRVQDSPPQALNVGISSNNPTYMSNSTLTMTYTYSDYDKNVNQGKGTPKILWYKNSTGTFVLIGAYNNSLTIPASELHRGDQWYVVVIPYDGIVYGNASSSYIITIVNTPPTISNAQATGGQYSEFLITDENINVTFTFYDKDGDQNNSTVIWYQNGYPVPNFTNKFFIPSSYTKAGDIWTAVITANDGYANGNTITFVVKIESRPQVNNVGLENVTNSAGIVTEEGQYTVWVNATDALNNPIIQTNITITVVKNNYTFKSIVLAQDNGTKGIYTLQLDILASLSNNSDYRYLIGTELLISVEVTTTVTYKGRTESIIGIGSFSFTIKDDAPPRVLSANYNWNSQTSPTSITFYASVQDFGSNISNVSLYYYFKSINSTTTTSTGSAKLSATYPYPYTIVQMTKVNATYYTYTVQFSPKVATEVYFDIGAIDSSGNSNQNGYPLGTSASVVKAGEFVPPSGGISPEMVIGIIAVVLLVALVFTFVGIRKFRSTELVGLDKELVLRKALELKNDNEIITQLDLHTLGIIVSFFDQRHGPIPIIVTPEILQDNYNLLVDLSDMSFSSARFSGNFEDEIYSTYNFNPAPGQFINIVSFGYALDRPSARGGAENITLNILIHKNVSELLSQFIDKFQNNVHDIHVLMDKQPDEKDLIIKQIKELRLFLSKIVITYEKLYGTTELLDSYDNIFDD